MEGWMDGWMDGWMEGRVEKTGKAGLRIAYSNKKLTFFKLPHYILCHIYQIKIKINFMLWDLPDGDTQSIIGRGGRRGLEVERSNSNWEDRGSNLGPA